MTRGTGNCHDEIVPRSPLHPPAPRRKASRSTGLFDRSRSWLPYSAFAKAFLAFRRIDFAARLRWLLDLLQPCAITGGANSFGQNFTFFHNDQSLPRERCSWLFEGRISGLIRRPSSGHPRRLARCCHSRRCPLYIAFPTQVRQRAKYEKVPNTGSRYLFNHLVGAT